LNKPNSRFAGCHVLAEFAGVDPAVADDAVRLRTILASAVTRAGATVYEMIVKRFEPHGVTVLALLAESHASIHTYPELAAVFIDVFTCGESADAKRAVELLREELAPADADIRTVLRGASKEITEPVAPGLSQNWQLPEVICDVHTGFQRVVIGRTGQGIALFMDSECQSTELSQLVYHEALLVPALLLANRIERVLVIGSGEGVVSQLAVAAGATHVDHVDIDRQAVRLCAEHLPYGYSLEQLLRAEQGIGPIKVHYDDGYSFVEDAATSYDVIVIDLPDERFEAPHSNRLYAADFLKRCASLGGVVASHAGCPTLWRNDTLRRSWQRFHETFGSVVYFGSDEHEWAFLYGLTAPLENSVATMKAQLRRLRYRPRTIDAETLSGSTVPPHALRLRPR
jgi:spermidine synthase